MGDEIVWKGKSKPDTMGFPHEMLGDCQTSLKPSEDSHQQIGDST
jgi:hypothetical protein